MRLIDLCVHIYDHIHFTLHVYIGLENTCFFFRGTFNWATKKLWLCSDLCYVSVVCHQAYKTLTWKFSMLHNLKPWPIVFKCAINGQYLTTHNLMAQLTVKLTMVKIIGQDHRSRSRPSRTPVLSWSDNQTILRKKKKKKHKTNQVSYPDNNWRQIINNWSCFVYYDPYRYLEW